MKSCPVAAPLRPIAVQDWEDRAWARLAVAALAHDEVQVWMATVPDDAAQRPALVGLLSPDERMRADRFRVPEARHQFVFGRACLRQLLGACLKIAPATLGFDCGPRGKPRLVHPPWAADLRFNLAHSHSVVAIAVARGREVGVDLEWIDPLADWGPLATRVFSPRELGELRALARPQQRAAFYNGWTRKEAYLKAIGEGVTDALPVIEVTVAPGQAPELRGLPAGPEAARQWAMRGIPWSPEFAGAVVFSNPSESRPLSEPGSSSNVRRCPSGTPTAR